MDMNEPYSTEITQRISAFVDRIEQVLLKRSIPRAERTSICQEVETQIQMMIERRIESGSELSIDLVNSIIESMDPPESYSPAMEPIADPTAEPTTEQILQTEATAQASEKVKSKPWSKPIFTDYVGKFLDRPKRTTPALDWVAICGLMATCFGIFLVITRPGRGDDSAFFGLFFVLAGVTASGISFYRIRRSNGLLTGQRLASIGILLLPLLLLNAILIAILFRTPFGIVLGILTVVAALIYGNYYFLRHAMRWLASYSTKEPNAETAIPELNTDNGMLSGVTN